jgi:guanine deaminase
VDFLKRAVELSKESFEKGRFPAGAVLVKDGNIVGTGISGLYPKIHIHAETRLIDEAMEKQNTQLEDFELYTSLEPCMMCLGKAYWSGIKKITYILSRQDVDHTLAYETSHSSDEMQSRLNNDIELVQNKTYSKEALEIYRIWEEKINA